MATPGYFYVRREMPNYAQARERGWDTPLFAWDDPRLAQQIAAARQAGVQYGIWGDPGNMDPVEYARRMAQLNQQYNPALLVADLEFPYKGYAGSEGWQRNQRLADAWKQYLPGVRTAVTPMGWQADFNYGAWNQLVDMWMPQLYGADSVREGGLPGDPRKAIQILIDAGVDPSKINPILANAALRQGVQSNIGPYSLWTYDDLMTAGLPQYNPVTGAIVPAQTKTAPGLASVANTPPAPPVPRLSQSQDKVQQSGLQWFGRSYNTADQFAKALASRGQDFDTWAANHPLAAAGLLARQQGGQQAFRAANQNAPVRWGGKTFHKVSDLREFIEGQGRDFNQWARMHQAAAARLRKNQ